MSAPRGPSGGPPPIGALFLRDVRHGGSEGQAGEVAAALAGFVDAAARSVDVAIYDFRLSAPQLSGPVVGALRTAAERGVAVRIGYDAGKPAGVAALERFAEVGGDPAPAGTAEWLSEHFAGTGVQLKAIEAAPQLMHSKYVVRDAPPAGADAAGAAVWTGSTNFTDDAWNLQENNVLTVADPGVAAGYRADFEQLWATGAIAGSGAGDAGTATVQGASVGWDFSPADGPALDAALVARIRGARSRLVVAAMVLTSHDVLAALAAAVDRGLPVSGVYDGAQMDPIVARWESRPADAAVLTAWRTVSAHLARKDSTPYTPTGPHDFMHLKVLLADGVVTTGSYNFSANAQRNAENQLHLDDAATVGGYADYLEAVIAAYR